MTVFESIVVIVARPTSAQPVGESLVGRALERNPRATIAVIGVDLQSGAKLADYLAVPLDRCTRTLHRLGAPRIYKRFAQSPAGRMLNSIGPLDPGRVTWRSIRRHPDARALMSRADLLIASDDASIMTAWHARRRGWVPEARFDPRSRPPDIDTVGSA
jgi:hypothetical protein